MTNMKLSQILENVKVKNEYIDVEITDVTADSRKVEKGSLFVCIKGASFDGHSVAEKMIEKGAVCVVCERDLGLDRQVIVDDTRKAFSPICASFYANPTKQLKLIGLTGTNGKTTTTFLIKQILENTGKKVGLIGTVQNMVGNEVYPAHYTTPDPKELQSLFRKMADAGCEYCVMEVSSQALAQGRVEGIHFSVGAFTNLTQDHLDYHKTWENYFQAKKKLFYACDTAVTNIDDKYGLKIVEDCGCKVFTYAVDNMHADFAARNVHFASNGVRYELIGERIGRVNCPIPGRFSVYNSLCAASVASVLGIDFDDILTAIEKSKGVKGRVEVVPTPGKDYTVLIDYSHTPDSLENILRAVRGFCTGRIIAVFGCGGDRDPFKRPVMGKIAAELSDLAIVTSDNPRTEDPYKILRQILAGMQDTETPYEVIESRVSAIGRAMELAQKDDVIVLCGKGHETYQEIGHEKHHLDEREVVASYLEANA